MIIPTPVPVYTLNPLLQDLDDETMSAVERCVGSLTGHVTAVLVTAVGWTERHVVVELETPLGPMLLLELADEAVAGPR